MFSRLIAFASFFALALAQNQCTSLSTLVHDTTGAPSGLAIPDCSYIQANSAAICSTLGSWDIINSNTCYLKGPGYGCVIVNGQFSTNEVFYCNVGPLATSTATYTPISSQSALPSLTPSASPLASQSSYASLSMSPSVTGSITVTATTSPTASVTVSPSASTSLTLTPSTSPYLTVSSTGSPSPSASPRASPSPSASVTATVSPIISYSASASATTTASSSSTNTMTASASFTPVPSTNITLIYTTNTESIIKTAGGLAAISLAAIFGSFFICGCCAALILRRQVPAEVKEPARRVSTVELARRPSVAEGRRSSAVIIREAPSK